MGRKRKDKTANEWLEHGSNLLEHITTKRALHGKIKKLLIELESPQREQSSILTELNNTKNKLGDDWKLWVRRISQKSKDLKRTKFYIHQDSFQQYETLARRSGYIKKGQVEEVHVTRCVNELPNLLSHAGMTNTKDIGDLVDLLTPFSDALQTDKKMTLTSKDDDLPFSVFHISKEIINQLSLFKIKNFNDLKQQAQKANKHETIIETLNNDHDKEKKRLNDKIIELKGRLKERPLPPKKKSVTRVPPRKRTK